MGSYTIVTHLALYLVPFVGGYLNLSQSCSTSKVDESIKQVCSLSIVQDSSLLHETEMLLLIFLLVLINGVVPEQLCRRWNICVYMCLKN